MPSSGLVKKIVSGNGGLEHRFIPNYVDLSGVVRTLKHSGYRIVLTQGEYDLFHVGHKRYLEEAKRYGDILIVGVDTDELTRIRKGPKRPFDALADRIEILIGLKTVDIVTIRNAGDHFYKLIRLVKPDVLVMSQTTEDFTSQDKKNLLKYCGSIKVLPAKAGTSTTAKLRRLMIDGVEQLGQRINNIIDEFIGGKTNENSNSIHSSRTPRSLRVLSKHKAGHSVYSLKKFSM